MNKVTINLIKTRLEEIGEEVNNPATFIGEEEFRLLVSILVLEGVVSIQDVDIEGF